MTLHAMWITHININWHNQAKQETLLDTGKKSKSQKSCRQYWLKFKLMTHRKVIILQSISDLLSRLINLTNFLERNMIKKQTIQKKNDSLFILPRNKIHHIFRESTTWKLINNIFFLFFNRKTFSCQIALKEKQNSIFFSCLCSFFWPFQHLQTKRD